jgi:hypothetical protein
VGNVWDLLGPEVSSYSPGWKCLLQGHRPVSRILLWVGLIAEASSPEAEHRVMLPASLLCKTAQCHMGSSNLENGIEGFRLQKRCLNTCNHRRSATVSCLWSEVKGQSRTLFLPPQNRKGGSWVPLPPKQRCKGISCLRAARKHQNFPQDYSNVPKSLLGIFTTAPPALILLSVGHNRKFKLFWGKKKTHHIQPCNSF